MQINNMHISFLQVLLRVLYKHRTPTQLPLTVYNMRTTPNEWVKWHSYGIICLTILSQPLLPLLFLHNTYIIHLNANIQKYMTENECEIYGWWARIMAIQNIIQSYKLFTMLFEWLFVWHSFLRAQNVDRRAFFLALCSFYCYWYGFAYTIWMNYYTPSPHHRRETLNVLN